MFGLHKNAVVLLASVLMVAVAPAAHASLIALYTYDNASNLGADSSGNGNNLVGLGNAPTATTGKFGGGMNLAGAGALASSSGTLIGLPTGNSSYTIASWINPTTADGSNAGGIVGWGNYGTTNEVVAFRMNGNIQLDNYWWNNDLIADAGVDLTTGSGSIGWHFVAATFDAPTGVNNIYVDGSLRATRTASGLNSVGSNFAVGKTVNSEFFNGQMDNTAVFNQALTQAQLQTIAGNDYSQFGVAVPEPESILLLGIGLAAVALARRQPRQGA